ncbi:hypothetical protein [Propionimicrobium sp. PCR01-08-3]|uniref:hypothetical protein n=1 Tax=Propionimicrobium sp. PCR01-08-3 TaxID=3052086 RepID=UPI00255CDF19|nr:hypothetical protein [Propionimicrobium sp. PCR01-08-3]WIY81769.1 hypothetical protein QQ658_09565 [Propionimicrobium sp. PCR01-08-3]
MRTEFSPEPDPLESNDRKTTGVKTLYTSPEHPEPDPIPDDPASGPEVIDFETGEVVETEPRRA